MQRKLTELRKLRESYGVTQRTLAEALGVTQAYISNLESTGRISAPLLEKAKAYFEKTILPGRSEKTQSQVRLRRRPPSSLVQSTHAGLLDWAWLSFARQRETSDVFDYASIDSKSVSLLVADIAGSGIRGSWQAGQLLFGFHTLASTLSKYTNHPGAYIGPLAHALKSVKLRAAAPPSIAIYCLNCTSATVSYSIYGLPSPIHYRRQEREASKLIVQSADSLGRNLSFDSFHSVKLEEGDSLIIYTDGFIDWLRRAKQFNLDVINKLFNEAAHNFSGNSQSIINSIISARGTPSEIDQVLSDDATIVVISRAKAQKEGP